MISSSTIGAPTITPAAAGVAQAAAELEAVWADYADQTAAIRKLARAVDDWRRAADADRLAHPGDHGRILAWQRTVHAAFDADRIVGFAEHEAYAGILHPYLTQLLSWATDHHVEVHQAYMTYVVAIPRLGKVIEDRVRSAPWNAVCFHCGWREQFPYDRRAAAEEYAAAHRMLWARSTAI